MSAVSIRHFADFWPYYVRQHRQPKTRLLHAMGSTLAIVAVGLSLTVSPWFLLAALLIGYAFAWYSHFFVERNKPATLGHPFFSIVADYRMLFLMMAGKMDAEVRRYAGPASGAEPAAS